MTLARRHEQMGAPIAWQVVIIDRLKDRIVATPLESPGRRLVTLARAVARKPVPDLVTKSRRYDRQTVEIAQRVLRSDSNIVDVGANRGEVLGALIAIAPQGSHVAVEPLPRYAKGLVRRFPNVTVHQAALSDVGGTARFRRVVGASEHSSLDGFGHDASGRSVEYFDVTVKTLDEIAPQRVDFVKIDAEAAEYNIFRGAERVLAQRPFIAFELGANHDKVWDFLTSRGFSINRLTDWLDGKPPPPDVEALRFGVKGECFFLACPTET